MYLQTWETLGDALVEACGVVLGDARGEALGDWGGMWGCTGLYFGMHMGRHLGRHMGMHLGMHTVQKLIVISNKFPRTFDSILLSYVIDGYLKCLKK